MSTYNKVCYGELTKIEPPQDKTNNVVVRPAKTQSAWASAQYDQSLLCPQEESLGP